MSFFINLVNRVISVFLILWSAIGRFFTSMPGPPWLFKSSPTTVDLERGMGANEIIGDPFAASGPSWYSDEATRSSSVTVDLEKGNVADEVPRGSLITRAVRAARRSFASISIPSWFSKSARPACDLERGEADKKAFQDSLARALRRLPDGSSEIFVFGKTSVIPPTIEVVQAPQPACETISTRTKVVDNEKIPTHAKVVDDDNSGGFVDLGKLKHIYRIKHQGRPHAPLPSIPHSPRRNYKKGSELLRHHRYRSGVGDELLKWTLVGQAELAELSSPPTPPGSQDSVVLALPSSGPDTSFIIGDDDDDDENIEGGSTTSNSSCSSDPSVYSLDSTETEPESPSESSTMSDEDVEKYAEQFSVVILAGVASKGHRNGDRSLSASIRKELDSTDLSGIGRVRTLC